MKKLKDSILVVSKLLNEIAGLGIAFAMVLIVLNIILRVVFKSPILGTYEYVSFLSSIIVSCGIAYCAILNGHIAVDFIIEKFNPKIQRIVDAITTIVLIISMGVFTWKIFSYATQLMRNKEVSPTTQTPFFIFVYIVAFSFLVLCFVFITKLYDTFKNKMHA